MMGEPSQADQATACPDDGNAQFESSRLEATTNMTCHPSRMRRPRQQHKNITRPSR
jgi:hypothetical protein